MITVYRYLNADLDLSTLNSIYVLYEERFLLNIFSKFACSFCSYITEQYLPLSDGCV